MCLLGASGADTMYSRVYVSPLTFSSITSLDTPDVSLIRSIKRQIKMKYQSTLSGMKLTYKIILLYFVRGVEDKLTQLWSIYNLIDWTYRCFGSNLSPSPVGSKYCLNVSFPEPKEVNLV
jgi:hypothetical protein